MDLELEFELNELERLLEGGGGEERWGEEWRRGWGYVRWDGKG